MNKVTSLQLRLTRQTPPYRRTSFRIRPFCPRGFVAEDTTSMSTFHVMLALVLSVFPGVPRLSNFFGLQYHPSI